MEDEDAMAARGGGAVERGGPVGGKPARRADRRGVVVGKDMVTIRSFR